MSMRLTVREIAEITGGEAFGNSEALIDGVSTDSRTHLSDQLFIPIIAERNGHEFIENALEKGASAHLFSQGRPYGNAIRVADTLQALQDLAKFHRKQISGDVIGITGSVGKTTTKDIIHSCLKHLDNIHVSKLSFNNEIGLPLTILSADNSVKHLVLEMGARGPGQIADLSEIAKPNIGIVTRVSSAHTEFFKSEDEIADTKGALIEQLPSNGLAILNKDDSRVLSMAVRTDANIITYGFQSGIVNASKIEVNKDLSTQFRISSPWGSTETKLSIPGVHNISNALAAVSAGLFMGYKLEDLSDALLSIDLSPMRMESKYLINGSLILNDSYNANPTSMNAAIDTILSSSRSTKVAVLGTMAELGSISEEAHKAIGERLLSNGINWIAVSEHRYGGDVVDSWKDALPFLNENSWAGEDTVILIKGSRVAELDQLANAMK